MEAKKRITDAIFGLLLALGAWVLLNTINPDLLGGKGVTINQVSVTLDVDTPQAEPATGSSYIYTNYKKGDAWPDDQSVRDSLKNSNITILTPKCTSVGQPSCTSVYKLNTSFAMKLRGSCALCVLNITEGTAFWKHKANSLKVHYPDGWAIDLEKTSSLTNYFHKQKQTSIPWTKDSSGKVINANCYSINNGLSMVEESDHFHSLSLTGGCDLSKQGA